MSKHSHKEPPADNNQPENSQSDRNAPDSNPGECGQSGGGFPDPGEAGPEALEAETKAPEAGLAAWAQKASEYEAKIADLNDQFLRKAADFENFRRRANREKQEIAEFANQNLLLDLIPVIDDFERAIKSAESSKDFASFYEGIVMIEKRLSTQLENKWGLKRFASAGEPFDPNRHEALQMEKAAGISEAVVQEEFMKGYLLKDRVIRFAKVKVLMPEGGGEAG
jgi:molecular chaperone GrpE